MSDRILLSTRKGVLFFEKKNGGWQRTGEHFVGVHASYGCPDPRDGTLWACLDHGHWGVKLQKSTDDGNSWTELPAPSYAEGALIKEDKPASVSYLWTLDPGGTGQPERLYIGTVPGGLFVSDNLGQSWSLCESLWNHPSREEWFGGGKDEAGIHSILVDPGDSNHLFVGISCAGVFETTDGGSTWSVRNRGLRADFLPDPNAQIGHDPHILVPAPLEPDVLWQQNHCGIFVSVDAGENWSDVSPKEGPAGFGFVVAVDENNPKTAWVIPAESDEQRVAVDRSLCVCRTDDGGETWQTFCDGLPQVDCYDFVFRHSLDLAADRLAFGTACGSIYVSEDRGQTWDTVAKDLPPVYALRFV